VSAESGYNMIHFTPIQELGISNSAYSIRDQLNLSPVYSPGDKKYGLDDVVGLVDYMNKNWGVSFYIFMQKFEYSMFYKIKTRNLHLIFV
jgi:hypothetical protein